MTPTMRFLRLWSLLVLAPFAGYPGTGLKAEVKMNLPAFTATLHVPADQDVARGLFLQFVLENHLDKPAFILGWNTPLEGLLNEFLRIERDGNPVAYDGPLVKRGVARPSDYVFVDAGAAVTREVDIARAYDLTAPGTYRVAFVGRLHDVIVVDQAAGSAPPALDRDAIELRERAPMVFATVPTTFEVGADGKVTTPHKK